MLMHANVKTPTLGKEEVDLLYSAEMGRFADVASKE